MTKLPIAQILHRKGQWSGPATLCALDYSDRFLRRKRLETVEGEAFVVDLAQTASLDDGDALELETGALVQITARVEALYKISGPDLVRLAWHVGNRHTPCQINADHLLIQADPVIGHMLEHLGAVVEPLTAAFTPEGGAYGHGRTHSHEHVATAHEH
ncbi:urease accessory protein UreE [Sulfitobacter guttiformis]|uniref:Urease accessory protein UreE n=1 Tax=Sulfitobacter guttiformis TaxID=74349 RepID=A0A420DPB3_9RHOB|nr:urease accessory protein UreE [Sulfitobacter guttiformis]KIN73462.1 Urease accessory protein UreE [Sulfitobacter guttiformis KCTC 32187]RKE96124.1 urease accessory protein [Sulfitobacter guttiformis]